MSTILASTFSANSQPISSDFPFESQFIELGGAKLHYVESGKGDPVLFLHGVPMSAYSWRNIIPHVSKSARCIAIDFMGFGKSDKPNISYSFNEQYDYLESFISKLKLKNITLVMTDIGGIIGQKYARLHPENVKAIILMETNITDAQTFHNNGGLMQRMMFWMAGKDNFGYQMFVKRNMFIKLMPRLIKRRLSEEEKLAYSKPFETEKSRLPLFAVANSFPRKGKNAQPGDMGDYLNKNSEWLTNSNHPKLILIAKPGMLMNKKNIAWAEKELTNVKLEYVGKAKHLMEEDLPHQIGSAIDKWFKSNR